MDQQWNAAQEAEAFARVWKRVSPDPDSSPIALTETEDIPPLPLGEAAAVWGDFLRAQIVAELTRWRTCQALAAAGRREPLRALAAAAQSRARRMAAALFILTGVWYLPRTRATPRRWKVLREGYRSLFRSAQRSELRYTAAARTPDPVLADLFHSLAQEAAGEQARFLQLLASSTS